MAIDSENGRNPKASLQFSRISDDFVLKTFIRAHEIKYSNDVVSRTLRWQASVPQSNIGKHLALIKETLTSLEAQRPIYPIMELNAR